MSQLTETVMRGLEAQRAHLERIAREVEGGRGEYAASWDPGTWTGRASTLYEERRQMLLDRLQDLALLIRLAAGDTRRAISTLDDRG